MFNRNPRLTSILVAGLFGGAVLVAQQSTGGIRGRVTDKATGTARAGVAITIEHTATGFTRSMMSASDGTFRFAVLPIGNYRLTFKTPEAMASMIRTVQLGQETEVLAVLKPRAEATVTVVATADTVGQVNTTSAEQSVNVTSERLESLPVLTRNVMQAAVLAPGVQLVAGSQVDPTKKASMYISTGEGQGRGVNMNIDGGDNNSSDVGGYVSSIPIDAIGEFQVVTNMYKAEFGRSNAGFMNIVSKAGTNEFTGLFTTQFTNDSLRARSVDEGSKQDNESLTISALASGPIIKDKLFYMVSVERRDDESAAYTFTPGAKAAYPELGGIKQELKSTVLYTRLDWNINQMMNLTWTFGYDKNETPNQAFPHTDAALGNVDPSMLGTGENKTWRTSLKLTTSFSPALTWESNLLYFDYKNMIVPNGPGQGDGSSLQIRTRSSDLLTIPASQRARLGHDPNAIQNTGIKRLQWKNDLNYVMGDHFLKAGLDYQQYKYADQLLFFPETGIYQMFVVGYGMGNEASGIWGNTVTSNNVIAIGLQPRLFQGGDDVKQFGFYLQDDWTINTNWSLYAGLRVDKDTVFDFMKDWQGLYDQIYATSPQFLRGREVPKDKWYLSPRLQVVYKPHGDDSLTFKLGYGKFVAQVVDNVTGFSRALANRTNGLTANFIGNEAALAYSGASDVSDILVPNFNAGTQITTVNGHAVVLPADLTPYNYVHNVGGLRDRFRNDVHGWLSTATFGSAGKSLLASDFQYPVTDALTLGATFRLNDRNALDLVYAFSQTKHASVQFASDASDPRAWSNGDPGVTWDPSPAARAAMQAANMGDTIFLSNQRNRSHQLQAKYTYTAPKMNLFVSFVAKDNRSSYGGSSGAFDNGDADFYGTGTQYPYLTGKLRKSAGTEAFAGSIAFNYSFDFGTKIGLLGSWHSGKYYDVFLGYGVDPDFGGPGESVTAANPNLWLGTDEGRWAMDLGLRISHTMKFGKKLAFEPYVTVSNLLNNYDYGAAYYNNVFESDGAVNTLFGQRNSGFAMNNPRTVAAGFKLTF